MRSSTPTEQYPFAGQQLPCYVGGEFIRSGQGFPNINPVNGRVLATVSEADAALVDRAVQAARAALKGPWGRLTIQERCALLRKVADRIEQRFDEFLAAEIADSGKMLAQAKAFDIPRGAANFRSYADIALARASECYEQATPDGRGALNYTVHKPLGVVAAIVPWNFPFLLLTWKVAPALVCGNAVIAKPSEETPSSAVLLAQVMQEVGIPPGVFNLVHGFGPGSTGEALVSHPDVRAVTFTGETGTGAAIMRGAAPTVKALSFELGGKNAAVVFADCHLGKALDGLTSSIFLNTGQICLGTERVYIQREIFDLVKISLVERAKALRLGRPGDEDTTTGPLISHRHRAKVQSYFDLAVEEGAEVLVGGGVPELGDDLVGGCWIEPTLWAGLDNSARVVREEIFGPVAALIPFDSEEEAIALANDTDYGLAAAIWTTNLQRGHRVAQRMRVGTAWVNTWYLRDLRSPFGGVGLSGVGREGGLHSLHFYTESTNVCVQL